MGRWNIYFEEEFRSGTGLKVWNKKADMVE